MKTQKSRKNYKVHTNQKAGVSCDGQKQHLEQHIAHCALYQTRQACDGIGNDILCMDAACQNEAVICPA